MSTETTEQQTKSKPSGKQKRQGSRKSKARKDEPSQRHIVSLVGADGNMAELIYNPSLNPPVQFALRKSDGKVSIKPSFSLNGTQMVPPRAAQNAAETGLIKLAGGVAKYKSSEDLVGDLKNFIHKYADIPPFWEELMAYYILMTWVYDRFAAVPYLRFLGEGGTGKSRLLTLCSELVYKGIPAGGSTTASPLFRLIEVYSGTMVMDEADYKNSDLWSDLVKVLNQGYMRGFPVLRSEKIGDAYEPKGYDVFGPKIIGNRSRFNDSALEQRCLTLQSQGRRLREDVRRQLPPEFSEEARQLRNKLLMWRFDKYGSITPDESELLDLEPRLTQIGTPMYTVGDKEFRQRYIGYLRSYGSEQKARKPQALVVESLKSLSVSGKTTFSVREIAEDCNRMILARDGEGESWSPKKVGGLLRSMDFEPKRSGTGYNVTIDYKRLAELVEEYGLADLEKKVEGGKGEEENEQKTRNDDQADSSSPSSKSPCGVVPKAQAREPAMNLA